MPWHSSAKKDAISCEKLRLGAHGHLTRRSPNGKTPLVLTRDLYAEFIGVEKRTYRTETSHVGIGKDINRDSPSSGERTEISLNQLHVKATRRCAVGVVGLSEVSSKTSKSYKIQS